MAAALRAARQGWIEYDFRALNPVKRFDYFLEVMFLDPVEGLMLITCAN